MELSTITEEIVFSTTPEELYSIFMNPKIHAEVIDDKVQMDPVEGGHFSIFEDYCIGSNIQLIPNKKIVQEWNFDEDGWDEEHFSICTFEFEKVENGTLMKFTQEEVPTECYEGIKHGWNEYYWSRINDALE